MLIEDLLKTIKPARFITEQEIEEDFLLALLKSEVSHKTFKHVNFKPKYGIPAPTQKEEQNCLLPGAVYKRRSLF